MTAQNTLLSELEEALSRGSDERRVKTLQRITDLFVFGSSHFSGDHVAVFDNVFSHLIADVELSVRAALADRLAAIPNAPPKLIRRLAFDDAIDVAGPVLAQSSVLDNVTLVENANSKSQRHLLAISQRKTLAETVTDVLVERGNRDVALSVARNAGARFSEVGYVRLVKRSQGDDELTKSVGSRPEIPRQHFLRILTAASKAVRIALEAAHPEIAGEVQQAVAQVASAIQVNAAATSRDYAVARAFVESTQAFGRLNEGGVEAFARGGKFEETAVALAILSNLPIDVIERAMVQDREEAILIVVKAIGFSWPTAKAILVLCANGRSMSPHSVEQCQNIFSQLKRETAQKVVEFQRRRKVGDHFPAAESTGQID